MIKYFHEVVSLLSSSMVLAILATTVFFLAPIQCSAGHQTLNQKLVRPVEGSRVIAGQGHTPDYVIDCFLQLCDDGAPDVVVVCLDGQPKISADRWKSRGANSVHVIDSIPSKTDELILSLLNAEGVWFDGKAGSLRTHKLFTALLDNITERNGVIGGAGIGALEITGEKSSGNAANETPSGFGLLSRSSIRFTSIEKRDPGDHSLAGNPNIQWHIPNSSALIIHHGRQVACLGPTDVAARLAGQNGWAERTDSINSIDAFDPGDVPAYGLDLLSWLRSSIDRQGPVFPPQKAPATILEKGTLILHGGSGVNENTFERFIAAAGGKDAAIVCIPSASNFDPGDEPNSYSAERLRDLGCNDISILHVADPLVADQNERFLSALKRAKGIWIDGGRTYRMMDRFEHTKAQAIMEELLERDGVIGGSSAGCQVAGDFLVRGNPTTNNDLVFEGYTRGFGFIEGVILDAHFLQRGRGETFLPLMKQYPQMLGIGVDEKTAVLIKGTVAEVLGSNAVSFYNMTTSDPEKVMTLQNGDKYDLKKRIQVK